MKTAAKISNYVWAKSIDSWGNTYFFLYHAGLPTHSEQAGATHNKKKIVLSITRHDKTYKSYNI